jgi:hypothetical protein
LWAGRKKWIIIWGLKIFFAEEAVFLIQRIPQEKITFKEVLVNGSKK